MLAALTLLGGCKVHSTKRGFRIGTGCEKMDESCIDARTANVCRARTLGIVACKGPRGCVDDAASEVACDQSLADEKDPCVEGAMACSPKKDALLECKGGTFTRREDCPTSQCIVTIETTGAATWSAWDCR